MRQEKQLQIVSNILSSYKGKEPLIYFLKNMFRQNPQMGSRDRKLYTNSVFTYFRLGKAMAGESMLSRLAVAYFLCNNNPEDEFANYVISNHSKLSFEKSALPLNEKIDFVKEIYPSFSAQEIFPFLSEISEGIEKENFSLNFLVQPKVWIRMKRNHTEEVKNDLEKNKIHFDEIAGMPLALSIPAGSKSESLSSFRKGLFEFQDLSSQIAGEKIPAKENEHWWDVCAGSGGKSLNIADRVPSVKLFCTDNRETILNNLESRFKKAAIKNYATKQSDISSELSFLKNKLFDGIIADVPCTGSGTWARTPEQICFFDKSLVGEYSMLQRKVVSNIIPVLKQNGTFVYITCSVFKKENEENAKYFSEHLPLNLLESGTIDNTSKGADAMFVAIFRKR